MKRNELYSFIKENNLGSKIYEKYGKPYSSLSTDVLKEIVGETKQHKEDSTNNSSSDKVEVEFNNLHELRILISNYEKRLSSLEKDLDDLKKLVRSENDKKGNVAVETDSKPVKVADKTTDEYVDLGLPSGNLWCKYNVGAKNPWEYGDYFTLEDDIKFGNDTTIEDFTELNEYTTKKIETFHNVQGIRLTSKTDISKSIFIPYSGYAWWTNHPDLLGELAFLRVSPIDDEDSIVMFNTNGFCGHETSLLSGQSKCPLRKVIHQK